MGEKEKAFRKSLEAEAVDFSKMLGHYTEEETIFLRKSKIPRTFNMGIDSGFEWEVPEMEW